jgi:hypothetical protein
MSDDEATPPAPVVTNGPADAGKIRLPVLHGVWVGSDPTAAPEKKPATTPAETDRPAIRFAARRAEFDPTLATRR